jgi:hypothetical protein
MIESAPFDPKPDWTELSPDAELKSKVATLEQQKYSQRSYNEKR